MATPTQSDPTPNPIACPLESPIPVPTQTLISTPPPTTTTTATVPRKLPIKRKNSPPAVAADSSASPPPSGESSAAPAANSNPHPPFKFQRIWSESDEIRFLQGLLGCKSQGLIFPRDLNLFYDQFSANMPQPYTRSQLSEKLRRLKNKHRSATVRLARNGLDASRLAPHDRDVLHLCSKLWDPANAASSPFFSTTPGVSGNKRRRANPRPVIPGNEENNNENNDSGNENGGGNDGLSVIPVQREERFDLDGSSMLTEAQPMLETTEEEETLPLPDNLAPNNDNGNNNTDTKSNFDNNFGGKMKEMMKGGNGSVVAKAVLDVFEDCLKEMGDGTGEDNGLDVMKRKWRAQRVAELDVLAKRMRLVIEDATLAR